MIRGSGLLEEHAVETAKATAASPTTASVGVASATVVAANPNRAGLVFVNLSANTISFAVDGAAVLNSGISLTQNGVWEMDPWTFTRGALMAIAGGAASTLAIQEWSRADL